MSPAEYQAYLARQTKMAPLSEEEAIDGLTGHLREKLLHQQIKAECGRRNLVYFHGSMAHRAHRTLGEPDFVILIPDGTVLLVECKTRLGKLSEPQLEMCARCFLAGHSIHIVRDFTTFYSILLSKLIKEP